MRIPKFLTIIAFITSLSILYVYQQTEIFRLAYVGQKKQAVFEDLLDKNSILSYNIKKNASLVHIGNRIARLSDYQMPQSYCLVRVAYTKEGLTVKGQAAKKETILSRLFGIKRQAEAKTINP